MVAVVGGNLDKVAILFLSLVPLTWAARRVHERHAPRDTRTLELVRDVTAVHLLTNRSVAECMRHNHGKPSEIVCPKECAFLRAEPTHMCSFKCVPPEHCRDDDPLANFPNPETMRCEGCHSVACLECKTAWTCARCQEGFVLGRWGTCVSPYRGYWWFAYLIIFALVGTVVYYVIMLPLRPVVNELALQKGLEFREENKLHDAARGRKYKLIRDLGKDCISGIGFMLHFHWQKLVIMWCIFVTLVYFVLSFLFNTRPSAVKHDPGTPKSFAACDHDVMKQESEFVSMEKYYFFAVTFIYLVTFFGSIMLAVKQRRLAKVTLDAYISMSDFALQATGFPLFSGEENCEQEIEAFFKEKFPELEVIGATVCWDMAKEADFIEVQGHRELYVLEKDHGEARGNYERKSHEVSTYDAKEERRRSCFDPRLSTFDKAFGIGENWITEEEAHPSKGEIKDRLKSLTGSGCAFIVFGTERQVQEALRLWPSMDLTFRGEHAIQLSHHECEPETVEWKGFSTSFWRLFANILVGNLCIFVAVILLDLFFYAPYVMYTFMYINVKGMVGGGLIQGTLLGLLITVCNQIIYLVIGVIADKCGFRFKGLKEQFYVVQYTAAIFFNTCLDLWTVMLLAQGFSIQEVTSKMTDPAHALGDDGVLSPKALAEQPAVQRSVYSQLMMYLFPGCLLLPFLLEPPMTAFLTYYLPKWLVRSRKEVGIEDAERRLAAPPHDLSRYGDILVNVMLCVLAMAFTYRDVWEVFAWLLVSLVIIYIWDHYRFLRVSQRSFMASPFMDYTAQWLIAVPCAMMAAIVVFHIWAASDDGFLEPVIDLLRHALPMDRTGHTKYAAYFLSRHTIVRYMAAAFAGHLTLHFSLLIWVVPKLSEVKADHDDNVPYSKVASESPCTWFNANPVHCLRSKYIFEHEPSCILFTPGKEHVLKPSPEIGLHFNPAVKMSPRLGEDVHGKTTSFIDRLRSGV